jgi:peptidoglycan lytic transglycosylase F
MKYLTQLRFVRARTFSLEKSTAIVSMFAVIVVLSGLAACNGSTSSTELVSTLHPTGFDEPQVERDLEDIRRSGSLRVLLRNSSSSYYILRGEEYGFEFELAHDIAQDLGLQLQVVLPDSQLHPLAMLNKGYIDLVAIPFAQQDLDAYRVAATAPYDRMREVLVTREELHGELQESDDLAGRMVAVRHFSSEEQILLRTRQSGVPVGIVMHPPQVSTAEILELVADGTYPASLAPENVARQQMQLRPNLRVAFPMSDEIDALWSVRSNSFELRDAVSQAMAKHYHEDDGRLLRSEFYNVIRQRYYSNERFVRRHEEHPFRFGRTGQLSPYDSLFKQVATDEGMDWRLLAAMAFQESRFDPDTKSWAGAVGLLQLLPTTAGVSEEQLRIPELNVPLGAKHFQSLLASYDYLDDRERLGFALAAYNCGQGHLDDARMLSIIRNRDPNEWKGSVRESLLLLQKPQYHARTRYGFVRGEETVNYVEEILRRYALLRQLAPETPAVASTGSAPSGRGASD